jgi:hypothetical protein
LGIAVALSVANQLWQIRIMLALKLLSKKFKKAVADERGYGGNSKVGRGKNIFECRSYTPFLSQARALEFSHQEIGIKEEDDKAYLDYRSPDIFLHCGPVNLRRMLMDCLRPLDLRLPF